MQLLQQHFDDCGPIYLAYSGNPWACASAVLSAHDFLERPDSIRTTHNMTYPVRLDSLTGFSPASSNQAVTSEISSHPPEQGSCRTQKGIGFAQKRPKTHVTV